MKNTSIIIFTFLSFFAVNTVKGQYSYESSTIESITKPTPRPLSIVQPRFRPDRPGRSKTSLTVLPKHFYIETGLKELFYGKHRLNSLGQISARMGLTQKTELAININSYLFGNSDILKSGYEGFGLGLKYNIAGSNYFLDWGDYNFSFFSEVGFIPESNFWDHSSLVYNVLLLGDYQFFHPENIILRTNIGITRDPLSIIENNYLGLISVSFPVYYGTNYPSDINMQIAYSFFKTICPGQNLHLIEVSHTLENWADWQIDLNIGTFLNKNSLATELGFVKKLR